MKKKIKVVHSLSTWLPISMNWIYSQMMSLDKNEIENIVVCDELLNDKTFPLMKIYSYYGNNSVFNKIKRAFRKFKINSSRGFIFNVLNKEHPDILHSHVGMRAIDSLHIAKELGIKHIVSFYGADIKQPIEFPEWNDKYKFLFSQIDQVFCEGPYMAKEIVKIGCPAEKITVQRLGINIENIPFSPRRFMPEKTINFLIIAPFREKKGIPIALTALGKLQSDFDDFSITIIGKANNVPKEIKEQSKIFNVIEKYNLANKIKMLGNVTHDEMINQAYQHHVFISPSITSITDGDTEGGAPVAIIEMAATGMPIISTTHCDIPFVLAPEYLSYLCPENDVDCLVNKIKYIINNDINELLLINRNFIEQNLNLKSEKFISKLSENYFQILK